MSCNNDNFSDGSYILLVSALISLLVGVIIIILSFKNKLIEDFTLKIIVYMAVNDIMRSLEIILFLAFGNFIIICKISGYFLEITYLSNICWAFAISANLYMVIIAKKYDLKACHKFWFILAYVVTPMLMAMPFITDSYDNQHYECSIVTGIVDSIWRLCLVYVPIWIYLFIIIFVFFKIKKKLSKTSNLGVKEIIFARGYIYSIIIGIIIIPFTILRLLEFFNQKQCYVIYFSLASECWLGLHGTFNGIAICLNKKIRKGFLNKSIQTEEYLMSFDEIKILSSQ